MESSRGIMDIFWINALSFRRTTAALIMKIVKKVISAAIAIQLILPAFSRIYLNMASALEAPKVGA